ncbi:hypothetical protein HYFRA_00002354 [Hymenoscyphus fraxineus]|uniref:2EXR domain-containing protein n=1 Tax=Hymenoscyphus fraxineus TaxID=746836 RepID=A0A9N9Q0J4_9HELO|nr:hypothetical protein HYFRA_00002354 [Hymenoscyphus fraxineus]
MGFRIGSPKLQPQIVLFDEGGPSNSFNTSEGPKGAIQQLDLAAALARISSLEQQNATLSQLAQIENPTFHPFPRLPIELRQKIYRLYFGQSKVIGVICRYVADPGNPQLRIVQLAPSGPRNALHAVSRETRAELNRLETPYLEPIDMTGWPAHSRVRPTYEFNVSTSHGGIVHRNLTNDVILIEPKMWHMVHLGREWRHFGRLRADCLAIPCGNWKYLVDYRKGKQFGVEIWNQKIKKLFLVIGPTTLATTTDTVLITPRRCPARALTQDFWTSAHQCDANLPPGFVHHLKQYEDSHSGNNISVRPWDYIEIKTMELLNRFRSIAFYEHLAQGNTPQEALSRLHLVRTVRFVEISTRSELAARNEQHLALH